MHFFFTHIRKSPRRPVCSSLAFRNRCGFFRLDLGARAKANLFAVLVEWLQPSQMADNFSRSPEHVVFQLVLLVKAEPRAGLGFGE
jgi:hypothetical protein